MTSTNITLIGGPTALIEYGGLRFLTDPTFDPPGEYERLPATPLVKIEGPALRVDELGVIDAVLLSHEHHPDNLDTTGRAFLSHAGRVFTTKDGASRLEGAEAMEPWETVPLTSNVGQIAVTAVPAQHGPDGTDHLTGPVIGFVLSGEGLPTVYVSGDNAAVHVVKAIVARLGKPEISVLFAGAAKRPGIDDFLTLSSERAVEAAHVLGSRAVVAVHTEGWTHFSESAESVHEAFERADLGQIYFDLRPGETIALEP